MLVDTCVWVDHDRQDVPALADLLRAGRAVTCAEVVSEIRIGCGSAAIELSDRVSLLPWLPSPEDKSLIHLLTAHDLRCCRIGVSDARIVLAALYAKAALLTSDRNLAAVATRLGVAFTG